MTIVRSMDGSCNPQKTITLDDTKMTNQKEKRMKNLYF